MTCLNLPRSIRNLRQNMIFVGLMPGGHGEASLEKINHYLKPLVDELLVLMNGIQLNAPSINGEVTVKGVLLYAGICSHANQFSDKLFEQFI